MREEEGYRRAVDVGDKDLRRDQEDRLYRARRAVERSDRLLDEPRTERGGASTSLDPYRYRVPGPAPARTEPCSLVPKRRATTTSSRTGPTARAGPRPPSSGLNGTRAKLDLLMSSRIGADGKLYPLVSKLLAAGGSLKTVEGAEAVAAQMQSLGIRSVTAAGLQSFAAAAMPGLIAGGSVALGAGAVFGVAEMGSARMRAGNDAFYRMGGTPGSVGAAMALGGDDAAAKALAFGDRLRQGSYGSAYFRSQGIYDRGPYQVDKSGNYVRALDSLRGVKDVQERIRIARDTGLTDNLWTTFLSANTYRRLKNSNGMNLTPEEMQRQLRREAEYRGQREIAGGYWDRFVRSVGTPAMGAVGNTIGTLTGDTAALGRTVRQGLNILPGFGPLGGLLDTIQNTLDARRNESERKSGGGRMRPAGWKNIDPALGDSPNTVNGSTAGAIPIEWRGQALNAGLDRLNSMLGAF